MTQTTPAPMTDLLTDLPAGTEIVYEPNTALTSFEHTVVAFPNGYGVSVIRYAATRGLFVAAVLQMDESLPAGCTVTHDTPVTAGGDHEIGGLSVAGVADVFHQVAALPALDPS